MCKVNNIIFGWQRVDIAFQMNLVFYEKWFHSYIYTWHEGYNHKGICKINWLDSYVIQPKTLFINECCDIIVISEWVLTWMLIIEKCKLVCHGQKSKRNILRIVLFKDQQLLFLLWIDHSVRQLLSVFRSSVIHVLSVFRYIELHVGICIL